MTRRIGIFSGTFDPVHEGHIGLALAAAKAAKLDEVYFLVEPKPRRKTGTAHMAHRIAMAKLATAPHPSIKLLELPDKQLSVAKTLPRLRQYFPSSQLVFIAGGDMLAHMPQWPLIDQLLKHMELAIGTKSTLDRDQIKMQLQKLPAQSAKLHIIDSPLPDISSRSIRDTTAQGLRAEGLPPDVLQYIGQHWLYVSAPAVSSS